jgi:hypothetical protein
MVFCLIQARSGEPFFCRYASLCHNDRLNGKPPTRFLLIRKDKDEKYEMVDIGLDQGTFPHRL